jgi:hypothetical protein
MNQGRHTGYHTNNRNAKGVEQEPPIDLKEAACYPTSKLEGNCISPKAYFQEAQKASRKG